MAAGVVGSKLEDFKVVAENLLQDSELEEAFDLVRQARRILESGTEELFLKSQLSGMTIHTKSMKPDSQLWNRCDNEWGQGSGYRDRVSGHHRNWFADDGDNMTGAQTFIELVEKEWQEILERLEAILEEEAEE